MMSVYWSLEWFSVYWFLIETLSFCFNCCSLYWSVIDAGYSSFGLNHLLSIGQKRIFDWSSLRHPLNEPYSSPNLHSTPCPSAGWIFKSCVIHSFKTHLSPSSHSAHRPWTATSFFKNSSLTLCHSARRACPELQNLLFFVAKEILLPVRVCPSGRMKGEG